MGAFYPERTPASKMLAYYCERFDTVELNNSFYHLPKKTSLENWRDSTPADFCFAVKGSRFLTHMKKLKDAEAGLEKFLNAVEVLEHKLGPILFQLPPNWECDLDRFIKFAGILPRGHRYAFEFRNASWNVPEISAVLARYNLAYCAFHLAGFESPIEITADFTYVRLHGPGGKYQGSYSDAALLGWAKRIREWRGRLKAVYIYFDNDEAGYAAHDAARLKEIAEGGD